MPYKEPVKLEALIIEPVIGIVVKDPCSVTCCKVPKGPWGP